MSSLYFSCPVQHKETIYLISHQNLFKFENGNLSRLCLFKSEIRNLKISNDGRFLSFISMENSNSDLYTYEIATGLLRRRTFLDDYYMVNIGWKNDLPLFLSPYKSYTAHKRDIFSVDNDGYIQELFTGINYVDYNSNNDVILQRFGYGYHTWRNYQGGTVARLYYGKYKKQPNNDDIHECEKYDFCELKCPTHNAYKPLFVNNEIFFLSDLSGTSNIYKYNLSKKSWVQCTFHEDFYIKDMSRSGTDILYAVGGKIYKYCTKKDIVVAIEIIGKDFIETSDEYQNSGNDCLTSMSINNKGNTLAFSSRGMIFSYNINDRTHIQHTHQLRNRRVKFMGEQYLLYVQDNIDTSTIYRYNKDLAAIDWSIEVNFMQIKKILIINEHEIAAINHLSRVVMIDLRSGDIRNIHEGFDIDCYPINFNLSPDKKWIVLDIPNIKIFMYSIYIYNIETSTLKQITDPMYNSRRAIFSKNGNYIYFISSRNLQQSYNNYGIELIQSDYIYAICVNQSVPHPAKVWKNQSDQIANIVLEEFSTVKMSIDSGKYVSVYPIAKNKILLLSMISSDENTKYILNSFDLTTNEYTLIASDIHDFDISENREHFVVNIDGKMRIGKTDEGFDAKEKSHRNAGWCELENIKYIINPRDEWKDILINAWWLLRERFYNKRYINWNELLNKYLPFIDVIQSRSELNDIISEMIGENQTSHNMIGDKGKIKEMHHTPMFGLYADTIWDNGYILSDIPEYYDLEGNMISPLLQQGVSMKVGDKIIAISGLDCTKTNTPIEYFLQNKTEANINIKYIRHNNILSANIKLAKNSPNYFYTQWVRANREYVHQKTNGRVGYIHIINMMKKGYTEFKKSYQLEHTRDSLIIDVRYNGGGNLSEYILKDLLSQRMGLEAFGSVLLNHPDRSNSGNIVGLCDERTGSDGDLFAWKFKEYKLGKLIGKRTWGGTVGIWSRDDFVDSGFIYVPQFPIISTTFNSNMPLEPLYENKGVKPDIEVQNPFYLKTLEDDLQLNRAIKELIGN